MTTLSPERIAELRRIATDWSCHSSEARNALTEVFCAYEALAAEHNQERLWGAFWRDQVASFFRFAGVAEMPEGDPWKCNETRTRMLDLKDKAALCDRYRAALEEIGYRADNGLRDIARKALSDSGTLATPSDPGRPAAGTPTHERAELLDARPLAGPHPRPLPPSPHRR